MEDVRAVSLTSKEMNKQALLFVKSTKAFDILFPSLALRTQILNGSLPEASMYGLGLERVQSGNRLRIIFDAAETNMFEAGEILKNISCLLPQKERCNFFIAIIHSHLETLMTSNYRLSDTHNLQTNVEYSMDGLLKIFIDIGQAGWSDDETKFSLLKSVLKIYNEDLEALLTDQTYTLGVRPDLEMKLRYILMKSFSAIPSVKRLDWLERLAKYFNPKLDDLTILSKLFLIMTSSAKTDVSSWSYGIQWADHIEAIPANMSVAASRYGRLTELLTLIKESPSLQHLLNPLLFYIFVTPIAWLPENVGSVLLLQGPLVTKGYLAHLCQGCGSCLNKSVTTAIVGLSLMTVR